MRREEAYLQFLRQRREARKKAVGVPTEDQTQKELRKERIENNLQSLLLKLKDIQKQSEPKVAGFADIPGALMFGASGVPNLRIQQLRIQFILPNYYIRKCKRAERLAGRACRFLCFWD